MTALIVGATQADTRTRLYQWNNYYNLNDDPNTPNSSYLSIDHNARQATIYSGVSGQTFVFEARTENYEGGAWVDDGPAEIDFIVADENAGYVTITILPTGAHTEGAASVKAINLGEDGVIGEIAGMTISGNLATDGDVSCDSITGAITVTGTLDDNDVAIHKLMATNVTAAITLGGLYGDIEAGTLDDLTIGNQAGITAGNITISEEYAGSMSINAVYSGCIHLLDDLSGSIASTGTFYGRVEVDGDVVAPSWAITISENIIQGGRGGTVNTKKFLKRAAALEQCF